MRSQILSATAGLKFLFRECAIQANSLVLLAATLFIFMIDLNLPLGVAAGVPYALVIFASLWVKGSQLTYLIAALGFLFTILGFYLSPGIAAPMETVLINRGLALLLIVCTLIMVIKIKKANIDLSALMTQILVDPITGYKNRQAFETDLDTEILRCKRYQRNLSIAFIDIDLFKLFGDNRDYTNKNNSIKRIAQEIKANIRITDLFYRIDNNVLAILFPETDLAEAKEVCEAIRKKNCIKMDEDAENKVSLSIGIAMLGETDNKIDLCKRAEDALLISKQNGRNLVATLPQVVSKDKSHVAAILSRSRSD